MSAEIERHDKHTLGAIARTPGIKRGGFGIVKASVTRLINSGLVKPPSTNGKLFLTKSGVVEVEQAGGADALLNSW
jgi:hypothetical protein